MKLAAVMLSLAVTGCFTARAAVGPNLSAAGRGGYSASGGLGVGWTLRNQRAIFATPNFGVVSGDHANALAFDTFSYEDYGAASPFRIDARFGIRIGRDRFGEKDRALLGLGVAWLPWHGRSPGHHEHSEKDDGLGFDLDLLRGLGIELAVDELPPPSPTEHNLTMFTVNLVGEVDTVLAR